jgi:hypothetical protein
MKKYSHNAQRLILLLYTLRELKGAPSKRETLQYMRLNKLLATTSEDQEAYATQVEERWKTDIAFRRKDGVLFGLLFNNARDCWELTRDGRDLIDAVEAQCRSGQYDVRQCDLWSPYFKKILDPSYTPSSHDKQRPPSRAQRRSFFDELVVYLSEAPHQSPPQQV